MRTFFEFFAGGGMARLGLGPAWRCAFANDVDPAKCAAYRANFGGETLIEADIAALKLEDLPAVRADLAWASFPCQDLSLAGARAGLAGARSGLFFQFWRLIEALSGAGRAPRLIVIENVAGLMTSNGGADFRRVIETVAGGGYVVSAMAIDARWFSPQSRPRLFIFGFAQECAPRRRSAPPLDSFSPAAMRASLGALSSKATRRWRWLAARPTARPNMRLEDLVDINAPDWCAARGAAALSMMSARQRATVEALRASGDRHVGAAFRRIRIENGARVQRIEARFDGLAGCLRTPAGGSSRQMLVKIEDGRVFARLLSPREAARLMGLPEDYRLPEQTTAALKLCGDGVSVPVVRWIGEAILTPLLAQEAQAA
ncbi:DNA cytosine methyltransferase [Amphiplicatus metriothermophilus]|nr:DNA cytosine methyltransferase [Amphiplicatus metriothermophilus]MBB5518282.1 DNA (cytosine-5)-methyltransferase 1 [Amphiplicatus metriothermophilus]